jgi:DNA repair protein RadC
MNERAWCVPIRSDGTRLDPIEVGTASTAQTVRIPIARTLRAVLTAGCESFILVHSHPGDLTPSAPDKLLVRRFLRAATYLGMTLIDSVIEGPRGTLSMVENGDLWPAEIPLSMAASQKEEKA